MSEMRWIAGSIRELAAFAGVSPNTVKTWQKDPTFPEKSGRKFDLAAFHNWAMDRGRKNVTGDASTESLKQRKLSEEIRRIELANDKEQNTLVGRDAAKSVITKMISNAKHRMLALPTEIGASIPPEVRSMVIHDMEYKIRLALKEMSDWKDNEPKNLGEDDEK